MGMEEWKKLKMDRNVLERDDIMNSENLLNNYFQAWMMAQEVKAAMPDDQRFYVSPRTHTEKERSESHKLSYDPPMLIVAHMNTYRERG